MKLPTITPPASGMKQVQTRTGAEVLVAGLVEQGVRVVAGMPGGAALPLYDALFQSPIRHVLARHEQGAGFIAQGFARITFDLLGKIVPLIMHGQKHAFNS